ncbi:MAG: hypothetical protein SPD80_05785 [Atopobium sp.]|uniref:hypothetical protein n=1 Tax=Atopobium sp. TaxID=1872650 RepID=UPI002A80430B|nr:hypothetical protein [Atopobium sp.]MDY4523080.1 hypothetical protein [Atopobium sp.]
MKTASNQSQLHGLGISGELLMEQARTWVDAHEDEWKYYIQIARMDSCGGYASPNFALQAMRRRFKVKIPNAYAPALARIAMEQNKHIAFRLAKSKVDGYTTAVI